MLTTCTECGTRFRLSAEQLRQAEGQVRCGRCGEVFDAFTHLHGDDGTPWSVPIDAETDAKTTQPLPRDPDLSEETGTETHDLLGDTDDLPAKAAGRIEPRMDDLFADLDPEYMSPESLPDLEHESDASDVLAQELGTLEAEPDSLPDTELPPHDHLIAHPDRRRHRLLWSIGVAVLALLLFAQWANANRQMLSRNLVIGPSLSALYSLLGHPLAAPQALDAWQISNTNVTSDPDAADGLSITGSLANTAAFPQAWPLLRVELTDRYGDELRVRDFQPDQYLPAAQASALPASGIAAHFRIDVVDPGADAVGFQVTACLDLAGGRVCASDRDHE
ncbi:MAG TPA: DUF3426 domain-containing protein [Gammaproteobacteria bacterium]|nr:DUF3426 domain-containing protein [Gammaproteobacteria bacterium]